MSTDIKHQVMGELLGIMPSAIEKAEEQASRIIEMVKGGCSCSIPCGKETLAKLKELFPSEPEEDFSASLKIQPAEFTAEDLSYLKDRGHTWAEIGAEAGISPDAARKRVGKWRAKQKQFCGIPKDEPKNAIEPIPFGKDLHKVWEKQSVTVSTAELSENAQLTPPRMPDLFEPGAEEARQEADLAKANIRIDDFIRRMISKDPHAMDSEILQAVKRNFAGISISVNDIAEQRRRAA